MTHAKKLYLVGGNGLVRAGRHPWFGLAHCGGYRGWSNYIQTTSKRHADAQYRRLKIDGRQMDMRSGGKAVVVKHGAAK